MSKVNYPPEILEVMGGQAPTDEQWKAISWPLEPYVLVAGAGSGKTTVMAARVVYLALAALGRVPGDGILPGNVLCLTFTRKATENLRQRVRRALAEVELEEGEEPEVRNYHGFASMLIDRYGMLLGMEPDTRVLSETQQFELCARVLDVMEFERLGTENLTSIVSNILDLDAQMADHRVTPAALIEFNQQRMAVHLQAKSKRPAETAEQRIELAKAVSVYRDLKKQLNVIDFSDQIELASQIVEKNPDIARDMRSRFGAVLLDEYQDTNIAQSRLMRTLFGGGHPVTAVGDPDQNIYGWRGASLFNLLEFPRQFPKADGTDSAQLPLYTNFRSGARILEAADAIISKLPDEQRPEKDKRLIPWEANGPGVVNLLRTESEMTEAEWIADSILKLRKKGSDWKEFAVLCRTGNLFPSISAALEEREIPFEIVNLAGLITMPEVVEVMAYARAVTSPLASVALARILTGPRYRVGYKDLARLAAWAKSKVTMLRQVDEELSEAQPFLFAEALQHLDEVKDLTAEGRERLIEFAAELAELRVVARKPVVEFLGEVIRRTGIQAELDAWPDQVHAAAKRRNLANFMDQVHTFEPIEGELTLRAFVDYIDAVENRDRNEWSPAQPSDDDSVKMMTVHQAKGLEFDHVFVPGLAEGVFPNKKVQHNPAEKAKSMDFELRGDAAILPRFDGVLSRFKAALTAHELTEERRVAYVALTRARKTLNCSSAYWYGEVINAKDGGEFLRDLSKWAHESQHAGWEPNPDINETENPLVGYRQKYAKAWPPAARPRQEDPVFMEGWSDAAIEAVRSGSAGEPLIKALDQEQQQLFLETSEELRQLAAHLREREASEAGAAASPPALTGIPASGIVDYAKCPKSFYWSTVRPLPRFSGPAARIGTEIHRWIELRAVGQPALIEVDDSVDQTVEELAGETGVRDKLKENYLSSRFADVIPLFSERPFFLRVGGQVIRGRVDAIFGDSVDGPWEIVDWKTGGKPKNPEAASLQLDVYALACMEIWNKAPEDLKMTFVYLKTGDEVTSSVGNVDELRARVESHVADITAGKFDPAPGDYCRYCDFLSFCDAGKSVTEKG